MVTGAVGVAAYEALRKMVVKAPLRAATVSVATGFNVDAVRAVAIEETVSIFFDASSTSPPLTRIPSSAPRPVPTMMAVGVARPNDQRPRSAFGDDCQTTFGGGQHEQAGNHPTKHQVMDHAVRPSRPKRRNRSELVTTLTEENPIAAPATTGFSAPSAASGIAAVL